MSQDNLARREDPPAPEDDRPQSAGPRSDDRRPGWMLPPEEQPEIPVNLEAEQALLAAILANNAAFDRVAARVGEGDFASDAHGRIFAACRKLIEGGREANAITLRAYFDRDEGLADVGGAKYLARLQATSVAITNAGDYAAIVRDLHLRRRLMDHAREVYDLAASPVVESNAQIIVEGSLHELTEIGMVAASGNDRGLRTMAELRQATLARVAQAVKMRSEQGFVGLTTGLSALDDLIGGLQPGENVLVAARPSMGKTALGECMAWANARGRMDAQGRPELRRRVLFASFEMPAEQLMSREAARLSGVNASKIRRGDLGDSAYNQVADAMRSLDDLPLAIADRSDRRLGSVLAKARHMKRRGGIDLVIVDYIQLMDPDQSKGRGSWSRNNDLAEISKGLKAMAMTLEVPVVVLSQLSRETEKRENRRPQLSDLRDSGALEQDADVVIFIHREEYYLQREQPTRRSGEAGEAFSKRIAAYDETLEANRGRAELIVAKSRNDRIGSVTVGWDGAHVRFHDLDEDPDAGAAGHNQGDLPL